MKIGQPYRCNNCGVLKQESNHWFLFFPKFVVLQRGSFISSHEIEQPTPVKEKVIGAIVIAWQDDLASVSGVHHLCGLDCVAKALLRAISEQAQTAAIGGSDER